MAIGAGLEGAGRKDIVGESLRISDFLAKQKAAEEAAKMRQQLESVQLPVRAAGAAPVEVAPVTTVPVREVPEGIGAQAEGVGMQTEGIGPQDALQQIQQREQEQVVDVRDVPAVKSLDPYPSAQNLLMEVARINGWLSEVGGVPTISMGNMAMAQKAISQDLNLHKAINELALQDVTTTIAQMESALADPKLKDDQRAQLEGQLDMANKKKNSFLNAVNTTDHEIRRRLATTQAKAVAEKPETTDIVEAQVLQKARADGLESLNPAEKAIYDKAIAVSKGVQVAVGAGEKKYEEEFGAASVKTLTDAIANGRKARETLNKFDVMANLLKKVETGKFAGVKKTVSQLASGFGLDIDPGLGDVEAFDSMANQLALSLKDQLPGPMSDADREFLQRSTVELTKTREGNKQLVEIGKRIASRNIEAARLAQNMAKDAKKRGGRFDLVEYEAELDNRYRSVDAPSLFEGMGEVAPQGQIIEVKNPETGETEVWDLTKEERIR
jgi:hypothetical protein